LDIQLPLSASLEYGTGKPYLLYLAGRKPSDTVRVA